MHINLLTQYLKGLSENNNRPWFLHNKPTYDILRTEFTELVAEVIQRTAQFDKSVRQADPRKSLFRIYRDMRFSKDKSPYKTHFSAHIGNPARPGPEPGYYFQINEKAILGVGGGHYCPPADMLKRYRSHIVNQPARLKKLLKNRKFVSVYESISAEERLMRPPKGFDAHHPLIEQIRNRHFFGFTEINLKKHKTKNLAADIADYFEAVHPLLLWLREAGNTGQDKPSSEKRG